MQKRLGPFDSWNSSEQVALLEKYLPEIIKYEGEFGTEIVTFLPFVYNLYIHGLLKNRRVSTYSGMKPYYYFLKGRKLIERPDKRFWVPSGERWWPSSNEHNRTPIRGELYPNFDIKRDNNKILFLQNKYCLEWDEGPINFLGIDVLRRIFEKTKGNCNVVYARQGILSNDSNLGISIDHNTELEFDDLDLCERYSHVKVLEKRKFLDFRSYNARKLFWINRATLLAGVQGGSSYPWAYFTKDALILHKRGGETEFSYQKGFFNYLSNPPLELTVVGNDELFVKELFYRLDNLQF
jgi:hypothetical protein